MQPKLVAVVSFRCLEFRVSLPARVMDTVKNATELSNLENQLATNVLTITCNRLVVVKLSQVIRKAMPIKSGVSLVRRCLLSADY